MMIGPNVAKKTKIFNTEKTEKMDKKSVSKGKGMILAFLAIAGIAWSAFFFMKSSQPSHPDQAEPTKSIISPEQSTHQPDNATIAEKLEQPRLPVAGEPGEEDEIRVAARRLYDKALSEERHRRVAEEKPEMSPANSDEAKEKVPPPIHVAGAKGKITTPPMASPILVAPLQDTVEMVQNDLERNQVQAVRSSMSIARAKVDQESHGEAQFKDAEKIEEEADAAHAGNDFEAAGRLYQRAEAKYLKAAQAAEERALKIQREKARQDGAQQGLRRLINSYTSTFENHDLQALKTLFESGFTEEDEKAWSRFFVNSKNIRGAIASQSFKMDADHAEVEMKVFIDHTNQRGIKQNPLAFTEIWKLEERNGRWVVSDRTAK